MTPYSENDGAAIYQGDCLEVLRGMPADSMDAIVTDPPYGLSFMGKRWDYDVPAVDIWRECLRVLKPGGHLLAFAGTRTQHRMACNIEDAGFDIRDMIAWVYGSGFPKSLDVSKAIDKAGGMSPKKQSKELKKRRLAANLSREEVAEAVGCTLASVHDWEEGRARRVGAAVEYITPSAEYREMLADLLGYSEDLRLAIGLALDRRGDGSVCDLGHSGVLYAGDQSTTARKWQGWGTALKPALEPITVARKPLSGTVAANVLEHGTGAINVDGCRVGTDLVRTSPRSDELHADSNSLGTCWSGVVDEAPRSGRWPSNLIHDGSEEVVGLFPETGATPATYRRSVRAEGSWLHSKEAGTVQKGHGDKGSAARFFYCAKASRKEREAGLESLAAVTGAEACDRKEGTAGLDNPRAGAGRTASTVKNSHPTVKPIALMRYLVRLVTPPGGMVLDPFCGSGTTLAAAALEGFRATGIERDPAYCEIASKRVEHWTPEAETEDPPAPPKGLLL
jgi:DNA modification methylase